MSNSVGLSTVSELVKQSSLINNQQYLSAKQGLDFAETVIKTTKLSYVSQQKKLDNSLNNNEISKDDYDKQINQLKTQFEIDCAPWKVYIDKLTHLIEQYSNKSEQSRRNNKRLFDQSSSNNHSNSSSPNDLKKRNCIRSSSSSSDSDVPKSKSLTVIKKPSTVLPKHDSSTNTDPLEFSLRSYFCTTPNFVSYTAQTNRIVHRISPREINEIAAKQIVLLHDEGQLVRWNDVVWRILTHFHVQDLGNLGIQRADHILCIDNLIRTQNKINMYLDAYTYWQTIGTLNELETDLARIFHKNDYQDLLIGPIEKQPKIENLFRLKSNTNEQIKKHLKTSDVLQYLDQYMTKVSAWKNENDLNTDDFLRYVAEKLNVKHIFQLGIRIKSIYLARNSIKAMQANQRKVMEAARTEINYIFTDLVKTEIEKVRKHIHDRLDNQNNDLRQQYASMNPIDIINDLIEACREICQNYKTFRKILEPLQIIMKDSILKNIFQIALCHGQLSMPDQTKSSPTKTVNISNKKIYFDSSDSENDMSIDVKVKTFEQTKTNVNENDIFQSVKEEIHSLKTITFSLLSRIEQRLCEKFQIKHFHELGHGTFNNYIQQNEQFLFAKETKFQLSINDSEENQIKPTVSFEELELFMFHLLKKSINDEKYIEQIVCYHFHVESFEQLGHGSIQSFINLIKTNKKSFYQNIHYECLMLDSTVIVKQKLTDVSKSFIENLERQALEIIEQCSILSNLHQDTQWNLNFRPFLGKLKPFLIRHSMPILEIDHNTYLKLYTNSTIDLFKTSLYQFDSISTSGHLVSILNQYDSINHAPLSLLSNIVQNFFSDSNLDQRLYDFLLHLFYRIPYLTLSSIIQRIFLESLTTLEGSQIKLRETLWKTINKQDSNMIRRFIQLGEQLGFNEWRIDKIPMNFEIKTYENDQKTSYSRSLEIKCSSISNLKHITVNHSNPYETIEKIRREKFGVGLNLTDESQYLTDQLKSLIGRSLERLSKELYNTDMHFVLELIQNADDNQYNDKPTLIFLIESNSINIYNNELGFYEHHIQALCDIGKSTKGKHKQGYIGQKGIGFKSVFTVSNRPEIYSNGYQIYFDALNGPIGYILPNWINDNEIIENEYKTLTTRIHLPLKSENEMQKHKSRSLTESFNDIHPSLLLFLNRLQSIVIDNRLTNRKQIYERIDLIGTSIVEIHCQNTIEKWFIHKKQFTIPDDIQINNENIVQSTEIALAFPLNEFKTNGKVILSKQDVYAYLPLRTFGFNFIIQADFEVPSSRQDILSDSVWNQYLVNEIPKLFLCSLDLFYYERTSLPIDPLHLFLNFLPNEISIYNNNNLFSSVCRTILRLLRSHRFLPVINDDNLHMPSECVLVHDSTIKDILTPEILYNYLNLYYLRDDLYEYEVQLYEIGVHRLGHNQLIDVIKQMLITEIKYDNKRFLTKLFSCLYRCLNQLSLIDEQHVLKQLKLLKIFPLKTYDYLIDLNSVNEDILFFPSNDIELPKLIKNDLLIIDDDLLLNLNENSTEFIQIRTLFERLGIQRLNHRTICEQHIFSIFENEQKWKTKSVDVLIAYVQYIFDLWLKEKQYIDMLKLKSIVQLLTNENFKQPMIDSIHFTIKFGNPYDLLKDFNAYKWTLISDDYIRDMGSINQRKKFQQFLSELGVKNFLFPINNSTYEQLICLFQFKSITINKKLFFILDENWFKFNENEKLLNYLKEYQWIPTYQFIYSLNQQTNEIVLNKINHFDRSINIYVKTNEIEHLFAHHVPYIDIDINFNSAFVKELGFIQHVTLNNVLSMLNQWIQSSVFHTSLSHMINIYEYVSQNMNRNQLKDLIHSRSIVFIPDLFVIDKTKIVCGKFYSLSNLFWSDSTNLFLHYSSSFKTRNLFQIKHYYEDLKTIFIDLFNIKLNPTIDEYIDLLVHISSMKITDEIIQHTFLIFQTIGNNLKHSIYSIEKEDLQNKLSHKFIFPTQDNRWVSLEDHPMISDNNDISILFTKYNIPLINISSNDALTFFNLCDISTFSSSITIECNVENLSDGKSIENLLSPLIPYIQLYMKSRSEFADAYKWTKTINMSNILRNLKFFIVDDLQLIYRLKSDQSMCIVTNDKSFYDRNQFVFYIHREWTEQTKYYRDIFHSFSRLFIPDNNDHELIRLLANFMSLLHNEDENNMNIFAKYQQFDLELKDTDDIPWEMSSISNRIKSIQSNIDENKVQTLLKNVAQNQEQYNSYKQKKRQEMKKQSSLNDDDANNSNITHDSLNDTLVRFDMIYSNDILSNSEINSESIDQQIKCFNIEDLTYQVLNNRDSFIGSDQKTLEKIGRWGEQWVYEYLNRKHQDKIQLNKINVLWLNQIDEQGKPYDFIIKNYETNQLTYIEVKSTLSNNRQLIPITYNELQHCCSLSDINENFQIYRIYNTGQLKKVKLRIVDNIEEKLRKHALELFLLI